MKNIVLNLKTLFKSNFSTNCVIKLLCQDDLLLSVITFYKVRDAAKTNFGSNVTQADLNNRRVLLAVEMELF